MKRHFLLLLAVLPAFATTITYDSSLPRLFQNIAVRVGGNAINVQAGQIGVQFDGVIPALLYCADPVTSLLVGPTTVTGIPDNAFTNGTRLAWLYNTYNATLTQGWQAAALQLAFWEVVMDNNSDDLHSGQLLVTSSTSSQVTALAGSMLLASAGQSSNGVTFWVPNQGPNYSQTLFSASVVPVVATPEPGNGFLLGAGLILLAAIRRR